MAHGSQKRRTVYLSLELIIVLALRGGRACPRGYGGGSRIGLLLVAIAGRPNRQRPTSRHIALLHHMRQLVRHQVVVAGAGTLAQEDVAAGGKGLGADTLVKLSRFRIAMHAHALKARAKRALHRAARAVIEWAAAATLRLDPPGQLVANRPTLQADLGLGLHELLRIFLFLGRALALRQCWVVLGLDGVLIFLGRALALRQCWVVLGLDGVLIFL